MSEATILIVDDERTIVRLCQRLLERASFRVIATLDPFDALKVFEHHKVDLLLTDIRMPVMDGFELISRAKEYQPDLPILVMTGFGSVDTAIQALHRGVDGLILKPFENSAELVQAVQRVIAESHQKKDAARLQVLRPLFDVSETLLSETSPQSLVKLIRSAVLGQFEVDQLGVYRVAPEGALEPVTPQENGNAYDELGEEQCALIQRAAANNAAQVVNASGPGDEDLQAALRAVEWDTLLVSSVKRNGSHYIFFAAREANRVTPIGYFTEADLDLFVILARQSAVALENARLYSELKDYVYRVEESQRALIQAEKMAAVGRLMASLAHEINNPLQSVRNCLHLAELPNIELEKRLKYLKLTDTELDRLVSTVRRMLDFYRPGSAERDAVNLRDLVERVLALLDSRLREQNIQVFTNISNSPVSLMGVPDQLQQVIFNLVLNSMDAMDEWHGEKSIWIEVEYEDNQVRVGVEDSGPGIPEKLWSSVFEPFVSTKKNGTGLGLSVSYGIIESHKGSMAVLLPRYKQGARIEFLLPVDSGGENG